MGASNQLNAKQLKFIEAYLAGNNGAQSARIAGYANSNAANTAVTLLKLPAVKAAIDAVRKESHETGTYNYLIAMKEADDCIAFAKLTKNANAMIRAVEHKAKLTGLLIEKHEVKQTGFQVNIMGLSTPGMMGEAIKKLEALNNPPPSPTEMIDVNPTFADEVVDE